MEKLDEFKKYFNSSFWKAFRNAEIFFDVPNGVEEKNKLVEQIYSSLVKKEYYPSNPICFVDNNKGKSVTRVVPVFKIQDYCVYYYCIKKIESKIAVNRVENTFGGWTLGGLIRANEDDEMEHRRRDFKEYEDFLGELDGVSVTTYTFNPSAWRKAYGDLNSKLFATAKEGNFDCVAELDIANFYDSIRLDILESKIREIATHEESELVSILFLFLNYWNKKVNIYNKQTVGLPQDAMGDCSRILANFYLQSHDQFVYSVCNDQKCKYLRYADDQFIFGHSLDQLKYIIFKISKELSNYGLSINQKKVEFRTAQELIKYRSFEIFDIIHDDASRVDPEKVSLFVDEYIKLLDSDGLDNIKDRGKPLLNRAIFCPAITKIDMSRRMKILGSCLDDNYLEGGSSYHFSKIYNLLNRENKQEYIKRLRLLSERLIHNSFHFELLDFLKKEQLFFDDVKKRIEVLKTI